MASWYLTLGFKGKRECIQKSFVQTEPGIYLILTLITVIRNLAAWKDKVWLESSAEKAERRILALSLSHPGRQASSTCSARVVPPQPPQQAIWRAGHKHRLPAHSESLRRGSSNLGTPSGTGLRTTALYNHVARVKMRDGVGPAPPQAWILPWI